MSAELRETLSECREELAQARTARDRYRSSLAELVDLTERTLYGPGSSELVAELEARLLEARVLLYPGGSDGR